MSPRSAWLVGAALGFLLAVAPSCGGTKPATTCTTSNCAGCCEGTICHPTASSAACGKSGQACVMCGLGSQCADGSCTGGSGGGSGASGGGSASSGGGSSGACLTCRTSGGQCATASTDTSCGTDGGFCRSCDTSTGEHCQAGRCAPVVCDTTNCADGCCDGTTCVRAQSPTQCGRGAVMCQDCMGGTCNGDAGSCVAPPPDGGVTVDDAGIPHEADGGLVACSAGQPCAIGCCIDLIGVCIVGNSDSFCGADGTVCDYCVLNAMTCNTTTLTCQ